VSRISYQNGKLYLSLTRNECQEAYDNIGRPLELDIGQLKVLHEDITKIVAEYWRDIEVPLEIRNLQRREDAQTKKT
tara:strand:+ start:339 stop:569 length:231 start_codon:yes stop_codon:yes gene_type:complete